MCNKCLERKPLEKFYKNKRSKDGHHSWCKECIKTAMKPSSKNSSPTRQRRIKRNREYVWNYLQEHPCEHCGINDPRVMDFDHLEQSTKTAEISYMIQRASIEALQAEIAKCQVLCANCHRIRSGYQLNYWWANSK